MNQLGITHLSLRVAISTHVAHVIESLGGTVVRARAPRSGHPTTRSTSSTAPTPTGSASS